MRFHLDTGSPHKPYHGKGLFSLPSFMTLHDSKD